MEVKQIYEIVNPITQEILGETGLVNEDLSNIVDIGTQIFNANAVDNYVKKLVDRIGKVIFVNRKYSGSAPSVLMDGWEYGAVLEKITAELPQASENDSWDLVDGKEYKQDIFYQPKVSAKFFSKKVTFEIDQSFTERQVKGSFGSASELNGFMSMLHGAVDKAMTVKMDSLVMRTINNMTAATLAGDTTGIRAVNLLAQFNERFDKKLTVAQCVTDREFIRFAAMQMSLYIDRMSKISTLFNAGGQARFTPADALHIVMLSEFKTAAGVYLSSDTFHDKLVALPNAETVPYWQGSGTDYNFAATSAINVTPATGVKDQEFVVQSGILAVMFDRDALGVTNLDRRVTSSYNAKAEFFNNFYKFDAGYFNDLNENFVVFYVAEVAEPDEPDEPDNPDEPSGN